MKIGIDARFVGPEGTGLGKYTEELLKSLQKIDKINEYFVFLRQQNWDHLKFTSKNFQKVLADVSWYSFEEQLKMPAIFKKANLDLLHIPHFNVPLLYRRDFIVTIHDLIHHEFFQESTTTRNPILFRVKKAAYKLNINYAISNSKKIIVPSKFVKDEIVRRFKVDSDKISVTYESAEEEYFTDKKQETRFASEAGQAKNKKPTLLYIGNLYPHKNIPKLLDALKIAKNVDLYIVCPRNVFLERLKGDISKRNIEKKVKIFGYQKTSELKKIMAKTDAYITPSLSEGFGIPGLNAMAQGVPVLASDIPTYREVYRDAAIYFDSNDPNDIAEKIESSLKNTKLIKEQVVKGKNVAQDYSWSKMAEETLRIYESKK